MRRLDPPPSKEESLRQFARMLAERRAERLVLAGLPACATLDDARAADRRLQQSLRQPSRVLDELFRVERAPGDR